MLQEISLLIGTFTSLFSIVNPLNATPVFLALTEKDNEATKIRIAKKTSVYMFGVLIVFFLAGSYIMEFFGLSLPGIRIAGGLMLASSAFGMLNPETRGQKVTKEEVAEGTEKDDPSFTPLAMPLLSGPGSIPTVLAFATNSECIMQDVMVGVSIDLICLNS
jgi:multiple antibiotic resistance protein